MGDFLTRLSERTLGVAPVVQPPTVPMFAPAPDHHPMDLARDGETPASSNLDGEAPTVRTTDAAMVRREDRSEAASPSPGSTPGPYPSESGSSERGTAAGKEDRTKPSPVLKTPPVRDTSKEMLQDTAISRREEREPNTRVAPDHPAGSGSSKREIAQDDQRIAAFTAPNPPRNPSSPESSRRTPGTHLGSSRPGEPDLPERGATAGKENRLESSRTTARHPRTPPETSASGPTPPGALSTSQSAPTKNLPFGGPSVDDELGEVVLRPIRPLVDPGATPPPRPSPGMLASLEDSGNTIDSKTTPALPAPLVRTARPRLDGHMERGPREPGVATPEPSTPTIRVNIGRIEVRAVTPPPPPPARRTVPARPGPALSLDDYLKQRNGGRR